MNAFDRIDDPEDDEPPAPTSLDPVDIARGLIGVLLAIAVAIIIGAFVVQAGKRPDPTPAATKEAPK